jgi:hypothetical protein
MGGDQHRPVIRLQQQFQKVPGIQPQDGPAVGPDIPDLFQPGLKGCGGLEIREQYHMVDLPGPSLPAINGTDFPGKYKPGITPGRNRGIREPLQKAGPPIKVPPDFIL